MYNTTYEIEDMILALKILAYTWRDIRNMFRSEADCNLHLQNVFSAKIEQY